MDDLMARLGITDDELARLEEHIAARLDSDGQLRDLTTSLAPLVTPTGRSILKLLGMSTQGDKLAEAFADNEHNLRLTAISLLVFPPLGWAYSGFCPVPAYEAALALLEGGASLEAAEAELTQAWSDKTMLDYLPNRIAASLVPHDDELWPICSARSDLVRKAWDHHKNGAYEASIPVVLAQTEGLMRDALGKSIFTKSNNDSDVVDDRTLAGMNQSLAAARKWFSGDVSPSQLSGTCSRHGIMHGREVAYDTEQNSIKAFVLLAAVYELCQPILQRQAAERKQAEVTRWAGSDEVDEQGRRKDRRGFVDARLTMRDVYWIQLTHLTEVGVFTASPDLMKIRTSPPEPFTLHVDLDNNRWWAWCRSTAGWVFAIAGRDREQWLWDGPEPPDDGPWNCSGWQTDAVVPPNWEG